MQGSFTRRGLIVGAAICLCLLAGAAHAGDCTWIHDPNSPGDWFDLANWDPSGPKSDDTAIIDNGGTASISSAWPPAESQYLYAGGSFRGSVVQSGGLYIVSPELYLASAVGGTGAYTLTGGSLWAKFEYLGFAGRGSFIQSGGTHQATVSFSVGYSPGAAGVYDLSGGSVVVAGEFVGSGGSGAFVQSGGTNTAWVQLILGYSSVGTGSYNLSGGSLWTPLLHVGRYGVATFVQTAGTVEDPNNLYVGRFAGGAGAYTLSGGSVVSGRQYVGYGGTGTFSQSGGANIVGGSLVLGVVSGGQGTYQLTGGSLRSPYVDVGDDGSGSFNQSAGTHTVEHVLSVARGTGSGDYTLSGGSLASLGLHVGESGAGRFVQTGGTNTVGGEVAVGMSGEGTYDLSGGWLAATVVDVGLGVAGTFRQSGGTAVLANHLDVGYFPGAYGVYVLSAGSLQTGGDERIGHSSTGAFTQSGGTNTVGGHLMLGENAGATGTYTHDGGLLTVVNGTTYVGGLGHGTLTLRGGTAYLHIVAASDGRIDVGKNALVVAGKLELADSTSAATTMSFALGRALSASICGPETPTSAAVIGAAGDHTLDLQTGDWRPREGQAFYVLTGFASISGAFDDVTTNITTGQQTDPNTLLPIPFFAADVAADPYTPGLVALRAVFQGLTAGDANGDHAVDGGDLALMGGAWWQTGMSWGDCDFNGDGFVDGGDLALMGGNWWWSASPGAPAPSDPLPEPASAGLLAGAGLALIGRRRHRQPTAHRRFGEAGPQL